MSIDTGTLKLTDVLDLEYLQQLQDGFAEATRITSVIVDPEGQRITEPSNWDGICPLYYDSEAGFPVCREKTRSLVASSRETGQPAIADCHHEGLCTASVPIIVEGMFLGSWIFGQLRIGASSQDITGRTTIDLGLPAEAIENKLAELPQYPDGMFERLIEIVNTITASMANLGKKKMELEQRDKELLQITRQLESRDRFLTKYIEASADAMYISDYDTGEILIANKALSRLVERNKDDIVGLSCKELIGTTIDGFCQLCPHQRLFDGNSEPTGPQTRVFFFQRQGLWLRVTYRAISWEASRRAQMVTIEDVTEEQSMRGQLEKLAYFDNLTGLPNTNKLAMDFRNHVRTYGSPHSFVICFDLSSLRLFSDAYGKETGDEMLKTIAAWFQTSRFASEGVFLLNGYEFCMVLNRDVEFSHAQSAARKIRCRFDQPWRVSVDDRDISYVCDISVAILHIPADTRRFEDVQSLVSRTLGSARKTTSGIYVYDESMDRENHEHIKLVMSLKECVNRDMQGFSVNYQPIVKLSTGLWTGVEALCRWVRPGGEPVSPLVFIHEAESLGLINELGFWVLDTAVRQAKEVGLDAVDDFFLSVNISPIQMMDGAFADTVAGILAKYEYPGSKLNLEITESARMSFGNFTMSMISQLRAMEVRMALDDFGTGYSSFSNLKNLPVDFLKTEREFVLGIEDDTYMQYFFYIMAEIAHASKMKLIAEGIETVEQLKIVKNNGADYIQGYFFSKPLTVVQLKEKFERFIIPDHSYIPDTADVVNIRKWLSGKSAYELTPALFNLMNRCMQVMLSETDVLQAFQNIFEIVGDHFGVSRAFAFVQDEKEGFYSNMYEWCARHVAPQKHLLQKIPLFQSTPSLLETFRDDGMLIVASMEDFTPDMQAALQSQDVMSVAAIPMWDEANLLGFVGFDNTTPHAWSPEEIVMLWNLAILMSNTLKREKLKLEVVEKKSILDTVMQSHGLNAYVTDPETDEILWLNESIRDAYNLGPADVIGAKCYEVLADRADRCPQCKIAELQKNPQAGPLRHEVRNLVTDRDIISHCSLIQWAGNKKAYIHYSMDVTDQRNTEKQLQYLASTDMMTGACNRTAIIGKMQELLRNAQENDEVLAICFLNVNGLKHINGKYGHDVGDQVIFHTVQALRGCIQSRDVIGRILSDDFIVLMPECTRGLAKVRMLQARSELAKMELLSGGEQVSFSFGVADNTEKPYDDSAAYYNALLSLAEGRMKDQKNAAR